MDDELLAFRGAYLLLRGSIILYDSKITSFRSHQYKESPSEWGRIFRHKPIFLDRWSSTVGYIQIDAHAREAWVSIIDLLLHVNEQNFSCAIKEC